MCNGQCTCGRGEKISQNNDSNAGTSEKNILEDTAASYNNSPDTDINGVVVD